MSKFISEIRKDSFSDKCVIINAGRLKRPISKQGVDKSNDCPFCPDSLDKKKIKQFFSSKKPWSMSVINNAFPVLSTNNAAIYGYQELIIESPDHKFNLAKADPKKILELLQIFRDRTNILSQDNKIEYILCFKNQGREAGASLIHSHSQIFASSLVPPRIKNELEKQDDYEKEKKICPYCELIKKERTTKRLIYKDRNVIALAPFVSEFRYEAWVMTKKHLDNICSTSNGEMLSLAEAISLILKKLDSLSYSYNFFLHQMIRNDNQHFMIKIQPRASIWAGVELGSGIVINPTSPEEAAKFYRKN